MRRRRRDPDVDRVERAFVEQVAGLDEAHQGRVRLRARVEILGMNDEQVRLASENLREYFQVLAVNTR